MKARGTVFISRSSPSITNLCSGQSQFLITDYYLIHSQVDHLHGIISTAGKQVDLVRVQIQTGDATLKRDFRRRVLRPRVPKPNPFVEMTGNDVGRCERKSFDRSNIVVVNFSVVFIKLIITFFGD